MDRIDWKRASAVIVTVTGASLLLYWIGKFAIGLLMPFLIAFLLALLTRPTVRWLSARTRCPSRVLSAAVTLVTLVLLCGLCYLLFSRLLLELRDLLVFLSEDVESEEGRIASFFRFFSDLFSNVPFFERLKKAELLQSFVGDVEVFAKEQVRALFTRLSERFTAFAAAVIGGAPSLLVFLLVTLISCFYFSVEYDAVCGALMRLVPARYAPRLPQWKKRAVGAFKRYLRAYFLLLLLTFFELLVGLAILGSDYVFLLAFLTALLDILPVLGVGTVLLPYALFSFVMGNRFLGLGLLILYGVITLVRQIVEPHLVGKSLGLHPILMLMSFYVGLRLFGIGGVLFGPAVAMLLRAFATREQTESAPRV